MLMMMPSIWHNSRNAGLIENSSDWLGLAAATAAAAAAAAADDDDDDDNDENDDDALIVVRDSITYRFVVDTAAADDYADDDDDKEDDDKELDASTELYSLVYIFNAVAGSCSCVDNAAVSGCSSI